MTLFVSPDDILNFLTQASSPLQKTELAQAFNIKGEARRPFREMLRVMVKKGQIVRQPDGSFSLPDSLPVVTIIEIAEITIDGETIAFPAEWKGNRENRPRIAVLPDGKGHPALGAGDRALARLTRLAEGGYEAAIIRALGTPENRVIGMIAETGKGYVLRPAQKKARNEFLVPERDLNGAKDGDLVTAEVQPARRGIHQKSARVTRVIGHETDRRAISLLSAFENGLRDEFPPDVVLETNGMDVPDTKGREDLRNIPLVTIDGPDARDFDDAVFAEKLPDGGHHLIVAIADVAYYVRPGSALDQEAYARGNSTYFPDCVLPMLPERLSNDLCSLRPDENRACLAVHMWIDAAGDMTRYKFVRGLMRSKARLTYEQVQAARDGIADDLAAPLLEGVIAPLYDVFALLLKRRDARGALDLDVPERQILINAENEMTGVRLRTRLDSHRLIEEFMILANVAAASALEDRKAPCVYRVHEKPDAAKLESMREFIEAFELSFPRGQVIRSTQINDLLRQAANSPFSQMISEVVLRTQSQAHYSIRNAGHFGLALERYAHFTSPIRRYADLLVHRSLIKAYGLGPGGLDDATDAELEERATHISQTERQSVSAERTATDRFTASYLSDHLGAEFDGRITGVTNFGLFVQLLETGADGLVPIRSLPDDYYVHAEAQHALIGERHGRLYRLGAPVRVRLVEANPLTGGTILQLANKDSADIPGAQFKPRAPDSRGPRKGGGKGYGKGGSKGDGGKAGTKADGTADGNAGEKRGKKPKYPRGKAKKKTFKKNKRKDAS